MSLASDISILQQVPLLANFAEDQLRLLAFSAESVSVRSGGVVFDEGERADGGVVLTKGRVRLETGMGTETLVHDEYGPGTLFGESALLAESIRSARAVALDDCELIRIRRALFTRMLQEFPQTAQALFVERTRKLQAVTSSLARVGHRLDYIEQVNTSRFKDR